MLVTNKKAVGSPPILTVAGDLSHGGSVHLVCGEIKALRDAGFGAVALDLTHTTCRGFAAAFALVEIATREAMTKLAIFGVSQSLLDALSSTGMLRFLNIQAEEATALASISSKSEALTGTKAVILCAGNGTRMSPLSSIYPKPMLDVLGKPVLERLINHLSTFGVRDILLNPGHLGQQIPDHFETCPDTMPQIQYFPEGDWVEGTWVADPAGSASTLAKLNGKYRAITNDVIVMCGDALTDIDLNAMMKQHRDTGAKVTIAAKHVPNDLVSRYGIIVADQNNQVTSFQEKPSAVEAKSNLANVGIYIVSSECLNALPSSSGLDIAQDLLAGILGRGEPIGVFCADFQWQDIGCGRDYFDVLAHCLSQQENNWSPIGKQLRPGLWVHETAMVSPKAEIEGPCYVGANSQVAASVRIQGTTVVGADCIIDDQAFIRSSIILNNTHVGQGVNIVDAIASGSWATKHRLATNKDAPKEWVPGLAHTGEIFANTPLVNAG